MPRLSMLREVAALFSPKSPDCLLGEVTQPSESWLNEISVDWEIVGLVQQ